MVTVSHAGYVKRVPLSAYRAQRRGGKGRAGMQTREEDFVTKLFVANTHTPILFFSSAGMVYRMKVWRLPVGNPQARGKALINLLPLGAGRAHHHRSCRCPRTRRAGDRCRSCSRRSSAMSGATSFPISSSINRNGKIAMKLDEGDQIAGVEICTVADDVLLTTARGQCIRFAVDDVRVFKGREFDRRARHQARRGRSRDLDGDPAPCRGDGRGAHRLSQDGARGVGR